jgi:hypothetical protein
VIRVLALGTKTETFLPVALFAVLAQDMAPPAVLAGLDFTLSLLVYLLTLPASAPCVWFVLTGTALPADTVLLALVALPTSVAIPVIASAYLTGIGGAVIPYPMCLSALLASALASRGVALAALRARAVPGSLVAPVAVVADHMLLPAFSTVGHRTGVPQAVGCVTV